jgi:hypothetical protein
LIELTPGEPLRRDWPILPENKPNTLFYSARKKSEPSSSAFMLALSSGSQPNKIYEEPGFGFLPACLE